MMKSLIGILLALFIILPSAVLAAKPENPGKGGGKDFTPIPNSVCLDPGHGGSEIGTSNLDLLEKDINLEVANLVKDKLTANGYNSDLIFMTRTDDSYKTNADRYNYCNAQRAAVLISVHHNGSTNPETDFTMTLYARRASISLAQLVAQTVSSNLGLPNNGVSRFASGVILKAEMPATISEAFFLTNPLEYNLIKNGSRLDQEANTLFLAIDTFLKN